MSPNTNASKRQAETQAGSSPFAGAYPGRSCSGLPRRYPHGCSARCRDKPRCSTCSRCRDPHPPSQSPFPCRDVRPPSDRRGCRALPRTAGTKHAYSGDPFVAAVRLDAVELHQKARPSFRKFVGLIAGNLAFAAAHTLVLVKDHHVVRLTVLSGDAGAACQRRGRNTQRCRPEQLSAVNCRFSHSFSPDLRTHAKVRCVQTDDVRPALSKSPSSYLVAWR